ncbi:hypothetical protein GCM10011610_31240 [Nocardia rhizosphaerihabitans]|uniref:Membrane transport protein MMPL domain-containing protein n=1 Tax=Nocardia rhizosphaerihabitans TaxID=1691570 RepID=A0ABQ2KFN0_9NOCA|nr:hypothetical protein GCM10011610_31240 [Nocardia rhizosphaerihabitans]
MAPAENLDLQQALDDYLPIVVAVILVLGFVLLLLALQAPVIAALGTVVSLLSTAAASRSGDSEREKPWSATKQASPRYSTGCVARTANSPASSP